MLKQPLVSIITPCYNADRYVDDCVLSVLSQTYKNWELILIDDCSTDKTPQKILKYCQQDKRIKFYTTEKRSGGPAHPRNIGISHASGDFIAFLDVDDLWLPNKLQEQIEYALSNNYEFVYSNYEKISFDGRRQERVLKMKYQVNYKDMLKTCEIPCLTVLISRQLIKNRLFKEIGKEDYLFWLEILKSGSVAHNTQKIHALYRQQVVSRSSNKLKMVYEQWVILRDFQKISFLQAVYYLLCYIFKGFKKYIK